MKRLLPTFAIFLLLAPAAHAQGHAHGGKKGPHGGVLQDVIGVEAELVSVERTVTLHVYDEAGKPVPTAGYSGSALVGAGSARQVIQLVPGPDNTISGTANAAISRGTPMTVQIKNSSGKSGQAKF